jgi:Skp family chaperone for outer membrane proteins
MKLILITFFSILSLTSAFAQRDTFPTVSKVEYEILKVEFQKGLDLSAQLETQYKEATGILEEMKITNEELKELVEKKDSEIRKLKEELAKCKSKKKN